MVASLAPHSADATYSLIAVDPERGLLGAAGASCVPYEVIQIYGVVPGRGALLAQANFDDDAVAAALTLLSEGNSASVVLDAISDPRAFPNAPFMQYGVADGEAGVVGYTGPNTSAFAGHKAGPSSLVVALGNVLTSDGVLTRAVAAFEATSCDLPERLVRGLEAAGSNGEGDSRCTPEGRPANSAFLQIDDSNGSVLRISVPDVSPQDPTLTLRAELELWRSAHPCPSPEGGAGDGGHAEVSPAGGSSGADAPAPSCALARMPAAGNPIGALLALLYGAQLGRWRSKPMPSRRGFRACNEERRTA